MRELTDHYLELVRLTSTSLPPDVEKALRESIKNEKKGSAAYSAMQAIIDNVEMAREKSTPICQDTGTPIFYVHYPTGWSTRKMRDQIREAVAEATKKAYLRPNAVDSITAKNTGNNLGDEHFPTIHFYEEDTEKLIVDLLLKGGGCENVGVQYKLPDGKLGAGRDLEGVRKAAINAVFQAQGKGCAPGILGIAIGGDRGTSYLASKEALLRDLGDYHEDQTLAELEQRITAEANKLNIGPMGFGGNTTLMGTKIKATHRLPACFFVSVSYMCWAHRRRRMIVDGENVEYS